ncbi:MAG: uroporphyrinogen decarboxylase [Planctomycetota bacterium]|nr:MAG: uroporphyrinogen decarboxylase [Planctomycetota bacterium]
MPDNAGFAGLRVAAFESRRSSEMAAMIERFGGVASVSPSMREVPIAENREAIDFAHRVITGQIDVFILMTGVGVRHLLAEVERHVDRQRFLEAISDIVTIVRGPKPTAVLKELGLKPTHRVPEPNTWREVLSTIDREGIHVAQQNVGLQEYGLPNASLVAGLEARGARVHTVRVYKWDLPVDVAPLEANVRAIAAGEIDVAMFTSAHQVVNLLRVADRLELGAALRDGLAAVMIASIGPTTSEALREFGLHVDLEPEHPKMGQLVAAAARGAAELARQKNQPRIVPADVAADIDASALAGPWDEGPFMKACRRQPSDRTPIWLMRQAGRYMSEYRAVRDKVSFLELCKNPELSAEVMVTAVDKLGVDAAIIFSDLLPILEPMGLELEFTPGDGPVIHNPLRESADVERFRELDSVEPLDFVMQTVKHTRAGIASSIPVIGFSGAPFTLASYAIEGGGSRNYAHTKMLMYRDAGAWHAIMGRLARAVARYLAGQIAAGAQAVQLFDSWAGCLGVEDYRRYAFPYTKAIIDALPPGVPVINFATGNPALLPLLAQAGGDVIGVDWRIELDEAWRLVGSDKGVQGNLDPTVLLSGREASRRRAHDVLKRAAGRPGHIFNLGHGVLPQTPVENVQYLVEVVREANA